MQFKNFIVEDFSLTLTKNINTFISYNNSPLLFVHRQIAGAPSY